MFNSARLKEIVQSFAGLRVLVVGDLVLDEYLFGNTTRISREAPVPIVDLEDGELRPGGAANTAANLAAMGAKTCVVGITGDDRHGEALLDLLKSHNIDVRNVFKWFERPTTVKTRVMAGDIHTTRQQLIRIDRGSREPLKTIRAYDLGRRVAKIASKYDAVALSDYGFGILCQPVIEALAKAAASMPVIADSRFGLMSLVGLTAVTPNEPETEQALNMRLDRKETVEKAGAALLKRLKTQCVLITRGNKGMALFPTSRKGVFIPIAHQREAVDVTGAGDTVVAAFTLALASGAQPAEAAFISNHAAGVAVSRSGTVAVTAGEIVASIEEAPG